MISNSTPMGGRSARPRSLKPRDRPWVVDLLIGVAIGAILLGAGIASVLYSGAPRAHEEQPSSVPGVGVGNLSVNYSYAGAGAPGAVETAGWGGPVGKVPIGSHSTIDLTISDVSYTENCTLESLTVYAPFSLRSVLVTSLIYYNGSETVDNSTFHPLPVTLPSAVSGHVEPSTFASFWLNLTMPESPGWLNLWMSAVAVCD
jgi:hypothetical protein